jgi:ribosomal protein L16 Arg81 hydroxylase
VLTGLARGWPATSRWTPEYLRDRCGAELVEVMAGREADERFEVNSESHKRQVRFSEYVDTVLEAGQSNDTYLVANNHFLDSACGADLLRDLRPLPDLLADEHVAGTTFMWFGPGGTVTPLHHDTMNVLLVQVHGHKRVTLVPSTQLPLVYNEESVYSAVDLEAPDEERHPLFGRTDRIGITLDAGDALFIPVGWWHHVRALDVSISVSFTNFAFPNSYEWQHPESLG